MKKQQVWATKEPEALEAMTFSEKYEGYVVDLIRELSKEVKFKYKMYIVEDKNYGSFNEKTGQWNGMIRDLIDHVSTSKPIHRFLFLNSNSFSKND